MGFERMGSFERDAKMGGSDRYSERDGLEKVSTSGSNSAPVELDPHKMEAKRQEALERNKRVSAQLALIQSFQKGQAGEKIQGLKSLVGEERAKLEDESRTYQSEYGNIEQKNEENIAPVESLEEELTMQEDIFNLEESMRKLDSQE